MNEYEEMCNQFNLSSMLLLLDGFREKKKLKKKIKLNHSP